MQMKTKWIIAVGSVVAMLLAIGIVRVHTKETVLEFGMFTGSNWDVANANSFVIIDKAIERFEAEHPGVKVHYYSGVLKSDYSEWLSRKILSGKTPDVFMILGNDFDKFSDMGIMKKLDTLMLRDPSFDSDAYFSSALRSGQYYGAQYALPYETVPSLMFVNKTLLAKEGIEMPAQDWTWEDLTEICRKVTKDTDYDGVLDQFGTCNFDWLDAVYSNGGTLFDPNGSACYLADERVVDSVRLIRQLSDLYANRKVTQEDFNVGKVAFMPLTFAEYRTYKTYPYKVKKYANFQWDCITMPAGKSGGNYSQLDTLLMGIGAHTKKEALAWDFLKLLTSDVEIQTEIFRESQGASVLREVTTSKEAESIIQDQMAEGDTVISGTLLGNIIEEGQIAPKFKRYEQALALAESEVSAILEDQKTIESSMKISQRTINEFLKQ